METNTPDSGYVRGVSQPAVGKVTRANLLWTYRQRVHLLGHVYKYVWVPGVVAKVGSWSRPGTHFAYR